MQWPDMLKDVVLLVLGGIGTSAWFFWRRKVEQTPVFENIQKAERLLSLRKELDNTNCTVEDLKNLEDALMGRANVARELSITYENEAKQVREIELNGSMSQTEMNIASAQAYRKAEKRLDTVIEQIKEFLSPDECARLNSTNEAWQMYQQKHADFLASRYEGGSIQPLIHASALETVTIARLVELEAELNFMRETRGQPA